jgi:hypothetical protein
VSRVFVYREILDVLSPPRKDVEDEIEEGC